MSKLHVQMRESKNMLPFHTAFSPTRAFHVLPLPHFLSSLGLFIPFFLWKNNKINLTLSKKISYEHILYYSVWIYFALDDEMNIT